MIKLEERFNRLYNLIESKEDIQAFEKKFGAIAYDNFITYKDRIKKLKDENGKPISLDLTYHVKHTSLEDMGEIIKRAENKEYIIGEKEEFDVEGKLIPKPKHTKEQLLLKDFGNYQLYEVGDYEDMIMMSEGTGDGSIGGRETGWCIGGRYEVPFGQVKVSQAKHYFNEYIKDYDLDGGRFFVLVDGNKKFALMKRNNDIISITDNDDNDHYLKPHLDERGESTDVYYNEFIAKYPGVAEWFKIKDWNKEVYFYDDEFAEVPNRVVKVEVDDSLDHIPSGAFMGLKALKFVKIPNTIKSIDSDAFRDCWSLSSIIIPDSVTKIGSSVFTDCENLQSIKMSNNITNIGGYAFSGCTKLTEFNFPNKLEYIGARAFLGCSVLTKIEFPKSVIKIGECVFKGCKHLRSIYIPFEDESEAIEFIRNTGLGKAINSSRLNSSVDIMSSITGEVFFEL